MLKFLNEKAESGQDKIFKILLNKDALSFFEEFKALNGVREEDVLLTLDVDSEDCLSKLEESLKKYGSEASYVVAIGLPSQLTKEESVILAKPLEYINSIDKVSIKILNCTKANIEAIPLLLKGLPKSQLKFYSKSQEDGTCLDEDSKNKVDSLVETLLKQYSKTVEDQEFTLQILYDFGVAWNKFYHDSLATYIVDIIRGEAVGIETTLGHLVLEYAGMKPVSSIDLSGAEHVTGHNE